MHRLLQSTQRLPTSRLFSSRSNDEGKIPAHMFVFSLLLLPSIAYAGVWYAGREANDKRNEQEIRERYGLEVSKNQAKNQAMNEFFAQTILDPEQGTEDDRLMQVLHGGKTKFVKKRMHKIDDELYGTHDGVEERKRMEEELAEERRKRKERRRLRKKNKQDKSVIPKDTKTEESATDEKKDDKTATISTRSFPLEAQQATVIATVGLAAAAAGFLLGNRRN